LGASFDHWRQSSLHGRYAGQKTGEVLWEYPTNSGITAVPSSFSVDGKQYIAVQSGWGVDAERMHGLLKDMLPEGRTSPVPQGGAIWVFALQE